MRGRAQRAPGAIARTGRYMALALSGSTLALSGSTLALSGSTLALAPRPAHASAAVPRVVVRRVVALDAHGHATSVFRPGNVIRLRIQWSVRHATARMTQTTTWAVFYGRREVLRRAVTSAARDGDWSRVTDVTVAPAPLIGTHTFQGRVSIGGITATRSITFLVRA